METTPKETLNEQISRVEDEVLSFQKSFLEVKARYKIENTALYCAEQEVRRLSVSLDKLKEEYNFKNKEYQSRVDSLSSLRIYRMNLNNR